jgi:hypothetical protein
MGTVIVVWLVVFGFGFGLGALWGHCVGYRDCLRKEIDDDLKLVNLRKG